MDKIKIAIKSKRKIIAEMDLKINHIKIKIKANKRGVKAQKNLLATEIVRDKLKDPFFQVYIKEFTHKMIA